MDISLPQKLVVTILRQGGQHNGDGKNREDVASEPYIARGDDANEKSKNIPILCPKNWWRYKIMDVNNGYIASNLGLVTMTLPSVSSVGDLVWVIGKGPGGWQIAQNSGQTIYLGNSSTTSGVGGHLDSSNQFDAIQLLCITANTDWTCTGVVQGNIGIT